MRLNFNAGEGLYWEVDTNGKTNSKKKKDINGKTASSYVSVTHTHLDSGQVLEFDLLGKVTTLGKR